MEGSPYSKLIQLMSRHGYNKDMNIEFATVVSDPPDLKIKIDHMNLELDEEDLIVSEHLTKHERQIKLTGDNLSLIGDVVTGEMSDDGEHSHYFTFNNTFGSTDEDGEHTHYLQSLDVSVGKMQVEGSLEFTDELKIGDRVAVAVLQNEQLYLIMDRISV
ncbi:DUF2577 domain-containing protein [Chengkuizengella axinellae]|uniref:DUF2577 domain-containing protein n=1 Tax=Chengkuizengella axinellae TaxID=3064388 RepID=A0ABT9IWC1_9BACL|nr:DUF2577 domain-containing protein [Chengkuizengella sp. 2205SS18-9]MDP5273553.1 DUF2577 domain-containing protein [Chengkuizengella sp. 2205SS18-9]